MIFVPIGGSFVFLDTSFAFSGHSTGAHASGKDTTCLVRIDTNLAYLVDCSGYSDPSLMNMDEVHGGSPYGAGCLAGPDGSRQPSELEKGVAKHQGKYFGGIVSALVKGRSA